ncbi:MAG: DUF1634 domain-containing protein [Dehalococcoidia bacterium]|nr:DUF1634 domain-containing protein [Dehalococcoidia bacterium]MDD5493333.1 DUF1634 domain-containing protein [Dehalococcoidia bacterium]
MPEQIDKFHYEVQRLNNRVGLTLRICIAVSLLLITAGLIMFIIHGGEAMTAMTPVSSLPQELMQLNPASFITAGLLLILLMPVLIILMSFAHFIALKERRAIIVCLILIIMLALSFIFIWT